MKRTNARGRVCGLAFLAALGALSANATNLFFVGLSTAGNGSTTEGNSVSQSGFTFLDEGGGGGTGFSIWQASSANLPGLDTANTSLFETFAGSTTGLTQTGNAPFTVLSIDLAQYDCCNPVSTHDVTFTGTFGNNSTIQQTFTVAQTGGTPALTTFAFSGFTNIVKLEFTQGGGAPSGYQFDNVQITDTPEPATFALAAGSLLGLIALRKRLRGA